MVNLTVIGENPDFSNRTMTGRLQTLNSYDPAARFLTLTRSFEVMVTSLTGIEQTLDTIDIVFCIASHEGAAKEKHKPINTNY